VAAAKKSASKDRLAVIVSGTAGRAAAALGALQALDDAGLKPDVLVGVSGGALAAALYDACGGAAGAQAYLADLLAEHSWQDLVDLDFGLLKDGLERPYEANGFVKGETLLHLLLDSPLGHRGFQHLGTPLFIVTTDLNSGRELVFGPQTQDEAAGAYKAFAVGQSDLERVNVATAVRASLGLPGVFRPVSLDQYCLVDGGLRQRRALAVAAAQAGVTRILWLDAGLDDNETFSLVTDYAGQSMAAIMAHGLTIATADLFDPHTGDPVLDGKSTRYLNLAAASIGIAELTKAQQLSESGRRTLAAAADAAGGAAALFTEPALADRLAAVKDDLDGPRWAGTVGRGGRDVVAITDLTPPVQQEFGYEFDDYLAAAGLTKQAVREPRPTADWVRQAAEQTVGLAKLTGLFVGRSLSCGWRGLSAGLQTASRALSLDKAVLSASEGTAKAALQVGDALFPAKDGRAAPVAVAPAAAPAAAPVEEPVEETRSEES